MTQEQVQTWTPGCAYGVGQRVNFNGKTYRVIQAHTAQGDWAPNIVPALFNVEGVSYEGGYEQKQQETGYGQQQQQQTGYQQTTQQTTQQQAYEVKPADQKNDYNTPQQQEQQAEEPKQESFFETKAFKIGAGILGGAVAIGAIGAAGYGISQHLKKKAAREDWEQEARDDTAKYASAGSNVPPAYWVLTHGDTIPPNAIEAGREANGNIYYFARWWHDGGVYIGKADPITVRGCAMGYHGKEVQGDKFEILVGDKTKVKFVDAPNGKLPGGHKHVEGGHTKDGDELMCAQGSHAGHLIPGYVTPSIDGAVVSFGGKAVVASECKVLCYA